LSLDTSFTTDLVYRLEQRGQSFTLREDHVSPSVHKSYRLNDVIDEFPSLDWVRVASNGDQIAGLVAIKFEQWNRRANLQHLYVAPNYRGLGIARSMIDSAVKEAQRLQARCLWVETQNVNHPAVRFYQHIGFRLCGFDTSLYDPKLNLRSDEVALFFVLDLDEFHLKRRSAR